MTDAFGKVDVGIAEIPRIQQWSAVVSTVGGTALSGNMTTDK